MSTEALEHFRTLLTESFTIVAVDIFNQVQTLVKSYEDENKRLRTLLNSVMQPEVRLPRLVVAPEAQTREDSSSSASCDSVKEEPMECVIDDDFTVHIKTEDDELTPSAAEVDHSGASSATASAHNDSDSSEEEEEEEAEDEDLDQNNTEDGEMSEKMIHLQKTLLETPRFKKPDSSFLPTPDEYRDFMSRLTEAYQDLPEEQRPLITRLDRNVEFVDCALGRVPKGSPLSYLHPLPSEHDFTPLGDAPPQPRLPLQSQKIMPFLSAPPLTANQQAKLNNMKLTWEGAHSLEQSTRKKKDLCDRFTDMRLINCFRDVFVLKPGQANAECLISKIKRGKCRSKLSTVEQEQRREALREYCRLVCVNWYPCGLVVHPGAPWLAALPDGLVYDPKETIGFGLLHLRLESHSSFVESKFLQCPTGRNLQVKARHPLYWHVQGEMMVTGTSWSDLLVFCGEDMLVQRVYRDEDIIQALKGKVDQFFFYHFLPSLFKEVPLQYEASQDNKEELSQS